MLESEEAGDRASAQTSRTQNLVYTLPYATESIAEFLTSALGRVDASAGGTQSVIITRDAETALTISETVLRLLGHPPLKQRARRRPNLHPGTRPARSTATVSLCRAWPNRLRHRAKLAELVDELRRRIRVDAEPHRR